MVIPSVVPPCWGLSSPRLDILEDQKCLEAAWLESHDLNPMVVQRDFEESTGDILWVNYVTKQCGERSYIRMFPEKFWEKIAASM